jgi:ParB-like chromosome segregation protein Spo0J
MNQYNSITHVPLDSIVEGDRVRKDYKDLESLAASIVRDGLIHPICVNIDTNELVAGGRRFAVFKALSSGEFTELLDYDPLEYGIIPAYLRKVESPAHAKLLELEENLRREDMSWQEYVAGIAQYHATSKRLALQHREDWTQEQTGRLLNISQASVSIILKLNDILKKQPTHPCAKAVNMNEALQLLLKEKNSEAAKLKLNRLRASSKANSMVPTTTTHSSAEPTSSIDIDLGNIPSLNIISSLPSVPAQPEPVSDVITQQDVLAFYHHASAMDILDKLKFDHIVCDPPYGIDMANLNTMNNIDTVAATHQVEPNIKLIRDFIHLAHSALPSYGWLAMWYDLDHHEKIISWGKDAGFKVTRWPLVWCKTSACVNNAATYNITKSTEVCIFMRKPDAMIATKRQTNFLTLPNSNDSGHPFAKPTDLWKWVIETVSIEGQIICDPFCGVGSSIYASYVLNRIPLGIEIDDNHIAKGTAWLYNKILADNIIAPL